MEYYFLLALKGIYSLDRQPYYIFQILPYAAAVTFSAFKKTVSRNRNIQNLWQEEDKSPPLTNQDYSQHY